MSWERVAPEISNRNSVNFQNCNLYASFWQLTFISFDGVACKQCNFTIGLHRSKGLNFQNCNFTPVLTVDLHFIRKGCVSTFRIAILRQCLTVDLNFVGKGRRSHPENSLFTTRMFVRPTRDPCRELRRKKETAFHHSLCVRYARSPQTSRLATSNSHFTQRVTFCKPVFGCPCRLKQGFRRTWQVGVCRSCVTTPVRDSCVTTSV